MTGPGVGLGWEDLLTLPSPASAGWWEKQVLHLANHGPVSPCKYADAEACANVVTCPVSCPSPHHDLSCTHCRLFTILSLVSASAVVKL